MRRILLLPFLFLAIISFAPTTPLNAQTVDLFCDDFDSLGYTNFVMTRSRQPSSAIVLFHKDSVVTKNGSPYSATDTVAYGHGTVSYLTSPHVQVKGYDNIGVLFDQICYIDWFDEAIVEYRFNNGPWNRAPGQVNNQGSIERVYTGNSLYQGPSWYFSKLSNPVIWPFLNDTMIFTRNTTAWVRESFNMTPLINQYTRANNGVEPDSMQIRLGLRDNPASPIGRGVPGNTHRWWVDNFCIRGSNCELTPPNIILEDPPANYPTRYEDRVYWVGPYIFNAQITDQSQINRTFIEYFLKRDTSQGAPQPMVQLIRDTVDLNFLGFSRYEGWIPRYFINDSTGLTDSVLPGDSIYWKLVAIDNSPCFNIRQDPPAGFTAFQVRGNRPKGCGTQPEFRFPYTQTFDGPDFLVSTSGVLAESWVNAEGDFHDWYVEENAAPDFPATGPSGSYPAGGKYLLLEATGFRDSTAYLLSPCFDLNEHPNNLVRFYLNQNGVGGDTVHFDIFDPTPLPNYPDGRFINDIIPPLGGNKGDNWLPYEVNTYPYRNKVVQFRWRGTPSSVSEDTDIGLDSFSVVPAPVHDVSLERVEFGAYIPAGIQDVAVVRVQNLGALPTDFFDLSYEVLYNGNVVESSYNLRYNMVIQPGQNIRIRLDRDPADLYTTQLGEYSIRAWVDYRRDSIPANDTAIANTTGLFYKQMDCTKEYFDDVNYWVGLANDSGSTNNRWELGTPDFGRTNSAYTKPNSWDILLDRGYAGSGSVEQLITQFYSTEGADSVIMSFMNNRAMENTKDGVFVEFSLDRGQTWAYLDNLDDTVQAKHWYNSFLSSGGFGGQFVLSDTTRNQVGNWNNWLETEIMLPDTLENRKEILFRFIFFAELEPGGSGGFSMDNFLLYDQSGIDLEAHRILRPVDACDLSATQPFAVVVKNRGYAPVHSFDITYMVNDGPRPNQLATETINRTIMPRDTIHLRSTAKFNFNLFGFYDISFAVTTPNDVCSANDTLKGEVENIDGCSFIFQTVTKGFQHNSFIDSSIWRFEITNVDRNNNPKEYEISEDYRSFDPVDTNRQMICIKDGSQVKFFLDDRDTIITTYSFIAFDGENDTIFVDQEVGGASPPKYFDWNCPPERSAKLLDIIMATNYFLPVEGDYDFRIRYQNNGLDSIDYVEVGLQIDDDIYRVNDTINPPNPLGLQYTRRRLIDIPPAKYLSPGTHQLIAWVHDPNGLPDLLPIDDTLRKTFTVIDTSVLSTISFVDDSGNVVTAERYCTSFEDTASIEWVAYNPYPDFANISRTQDTTQSFVRATPQKDTISSAHSGTKAWITDSTENYRNVDSSALLSPFFRLSLDSCYKISFWNNYLIRDKFNDGGQVQISGDLGRTWKTIFYNERDSVNLTEDSIAGLASTFQQNWHNARHIKAIPDNSNNSGWTGSSGGWVLSENIFGGTQPLRNPADGGRSGLNPFGQTQSGGDVTYTDLNLLGNTNEYYGVFRFRFESDATVNDEGWAIDDFCLETIAPGRCFAVGLEEQLALRGESEVYVGQNIPNPANQTTSIPYILPNNANMSVRVVNVMGQEMYTESSTRPKGSGYVELDISKYAQGIYYYTIDVDGVPHTKKMIVTK